MTSPSTRILYSHHSAIFELHHPLQNQLIRQLHPTILPSKLTQPTSNFGVISRNTPLDQLDLAVTVLDHLNPQSTTTRSFACTKHIDLVKAHQRATQENLRVAKPARFSNFASPRISTLSTSPTHLKGKPLQIPRPYMSFVSSASSAAATFAANDTRSATPLPPTHSLRILIVDDNHVNLSVLSTLLKRRFGHALARPPVSLDSGLKALQLLRTQIFDLIFMDIEMPYLNGVECTRRIRAGEDGILAANRNAHVVAVTTNVGPAPASLYRHVGMDGMISKPVRFQHFQQYICPLSIEASEAKGCVTPVLVGSDHVLPPLPPIDLDNRLFFVPTADGRMVTTTKSNDRDCRSPEPEYSDANQFAAMLKAQTTKSLRDRKALSISRSTTLSEPRRSSFNSPRSEHLGAIHSGSQSSAGFPAEAVARSRVERTVQTSDLRDFRDSIRDPALSFQLPTLSFEALVDLETRERERDGTVQRRAPVPVRPVPVHRISSPAYLLDASPISRLRAEPAMRSNPDLVPSHAMRPDICPVPLKRPRRNDSDRSESSVTDSATGADQTASSSSAWSSTPLSSDYTSSTQRSTSLELLSSFSSHRATSPSSAVTTPVSSPADMESLSDDRGEDLGDDEMRKAVFSPCADDLLLPRVPGLGYLDAPSLSSFPPLSRQALFLQNSPRILICGADDDSDSKSGLRGDICPRMETLRLDQQSPTQCVHNAL